MSETISIRVLNRILGQRSDRQWSAKTGQQRLQVNRHLMIGHKKEEPPEGGGVSQTGEFLTEDFYLWSSQTM